MRSAAVIAFDHRPSRWVAAAIVAMLATALVALALSDLALWCRLLLGAAAIGYAVFELRRFVRSPVRRLAWHEAGHWRVALRDGTELTAELRHALVRGSWVVLVLHGSHGGISCVLGPDNCDADTRRRLRVRLARAQADVQPAA